MEHLYNTFIPQFLPDRDLVQFTQTSKLGRKQVPQLYSRIPHDYPCEQAAYHGHLEVLKCLRSRNPSRPWNKWVCAYAANNGHLGTFRWARENGCPWDEKAWYVQHMSKPKRIYSRKDGSIYFLNNGRRKSIKGQRLRDRWPGWEWFSR
jgi:hypothetical protein